MSLIQSRHFNHTSNPAFKPFSFLKSTVLALSFITLAACSGSDSSSGAGNDKDKTSKIDYSDIKFTAWVGANDSQIDIKGKLSEGIELYSHRNADCDIANITACEEGHSLLLNNQTITDTAFTLTKPAYYTAKYQSNTVKVLASMAKFSPIEKHQVVSFKDKLWVIGGNAGDDNETTNDIYSSDDGINWNKEITTGDVFSARQNHQAVVFKNKLWVIAGGDEVYSSNKNNDVYSSDDGIRWQKITDNAGFSERVSHQIASFKNKLWLIGGRDKDGEKNDVYSSEDGITWEKITPKGDVFSVRFNHQAVVFNEKLWVIGGTGPGRPVAYLNDVYSSDDGINWKKITPKGDVFPARGSHQVVSLNNKLWLIAGKGGQAFNSQTFKDVYSSDDGITWHKVANNAAFSTSTGHRVASFKNKLWIIGGYSYGNLGGKTNDVFSSTDGSNWIEEKNSAAFYVKSGHQALSFKNKLWVIGGRGVNRTNDVYVSDDAINWNKVATKGTVFSARDAHQAVKFKNKLWVIGGEDKSGRKNDVYSSDDGINWNKVVTKGTVFTARRYHQAVVFKEKLWVIGGKDSNGSTFGDVYSSDDGITWRKETTSGVSFPKRHSHQVVVANIDGSEKLWLIAGNDDTGQSKDVYSSADGINWSKVTTTGFSKRFLHQAVVFKNKLWVIGGKAGNSNNNTNDIYSSGNGVEWEKVTDSIALPAIASHQMVKFNDKLWILGGEGNDVWQSDDGVTWRKLYLGKLPISELE